ncbi:toxin-antitoxin system YwqK family antitoxin [Psychroserpens sp. XS_ASV72]|uniref:toxin-antitoxin system YwqK family antitoxin n=1 Tax=Psychroserpens sp. XS_ASV72 TaxID=3241293 RepID=UPI003518DAB2
MNKRILFLFALLITSVSFAQQERELILNKDTNLIDVTYYHDNGVVSQTGSYTLDGKLHGEWLSYDTDGNRSISANYDNGQKVGKWFYWKDKILKEVDYTNNAIVSVIEWKKDDNTSLAFDN